MNSLYAPAVLNLLLLLCTVAAHADTLTARVIGASDGDTFTFLMETSTNEGLSQRHRREEEHQPFGEGRKATRTQDGMCP